MFFFFLNALYPLGYPNIYIYHFKNVCVDILCEYIFNLHSNSNHYVELKRGIRHFPKYCICITLFHLNNNLYTEVILLSPFL